MKYFNLVSMILSGSVLVAKCYYQTFIGKVSYRGDLPQYCSDPGLSNDYSSPILVIYDTYLM